VVFTPVAASNKATKASFGKPDSAMLQLTMSRRDILISSIPLLITCSLPTRRAYGKDLKILVESSNFCDIIHAPGLVIKFTQAQFSQPHVFAIHNGFLGNSVGGLL
jgi:hypothetical protein